MSQTDQMHRGICVAGLRWIICLALWAAAVAFSQGGAANVTGIVEDSTGARIPDARVKLINILTGTGNDAITNRDGAFLASGLIPGTYTLQIERQGFSTAQVTGLTLNVGDTRNLLIRLRVGSVSETVEIDASGITLNTTDATVETTVDRKFVTNIPVNGRSFQDLITMTPGVLTQSPQAIGGPLGANGGLSVNGQKANANYFLVDGVSGNFGPGSLTGSRKIPSDGSVPGLTAIGTMQSLASVDALEEFRVLASSYSAEYGSAPGGQFVLRTRSGISEGERLPHGSIYDYVRYNTLDAIDWYTRFTSRIENTDYLDSITYIPFHQNDFGVTVGAPLPHLRNKTARDDTYVFLSIEEVKLTQPGAVTVQYTPSPAVQSAANAALVPLLKDFPYVYADRPVSVNSVLLPLVQTAIEPSHVSARSLRLDRVFSRKWSGLIRYNQSPSSTQSQDLSTSTAIKLSSWSLSAAAMAQLSETKSNDFRLEFARSGSQEQSFLGNPYGTTGIPLATNLLSDLGVPTWFASARGQVYIHIPGIGESAIDVDQASSALHQWNPRDTFSFQAGPHFLRLGIDYRHIASSVNPAPLSVQADFFDEDSLRNNLASDISITKTTPTAPVFNEFSAFIQDEWKVSKRLTFSPGLRWEIDPPPHGGDGADAYTLLGSLASPASMQLAPRGTPLWHTSWLNFAPRIGMAWSVSNRPGRETVIRAGGGVYFSTDNAPAAEAFNAIGFSATNHLENVPVPITPAQLGFTATPTSPYTNSAVFAFPRHFQLPYTLQWNVAIDRALGRNQILNISWVGAGGRRLPEERRININIENPDFGEINYFPAGISSSYQSLQVKFQRSITPGVQALASYAWSHTLDFGSTAPEFPLGRGNSDLDVRHNLQLALSWAESKRSGNWIQRNVLGGWGLDGRFTARTGFPVNLMGNLFSDPATGDRYFSGVDLMPGQPLYLHGSQFPGGRMFNGGPGLHNPAFTLPTGLNAGNAPRNLVRDFGDYQINVAFRRDIHLYKSFNLQMRAEAFNVFNHPNFGYIDPVLSNQLFGQATLLLNQSLGSSGPLYQPGGPRSVQVSLRLRF